MKKVFLSLYFLAGVFFLTGCLKQKPREIVDFELCCRNCLQVPNKSGHLAEDSYREPRRECKKICTDFFNHPRCPYLTEIDFLN